MRKVLIIRFSSIGDIVLTTPVIRCVKQQFGDVDVHFLVKKGFENVIRGNPYVDHLHVFEGDIKKTVQILKKQRFDIILDLQKNLKSRIISRFVEGKVIRFDKLNFEKWLLTTFKINRLPKMHIVDRYFLSLSALGVKNDGKGLEFTFHHQDMVIAKTLVPTNEFNVLVLGATHFTKRIPASKCHEIIEISARPLVLLGGGDVLDLGEKLAVAHPEKVINLSGKSTLMQSAAIISLATHIVTSDTGLMHIAAALNKPMSVIWGNTIPAFGMYPYYPINSISKAVNYEVDGLSCRPCSKLGYDSCPKGHFRCMMHQKLGAF